MQLSVTLLICVIATCIMTTCRCFFISNKIQASTNNVLFTSSKPICMVSKNSYNEGALTIEKRILHSIISFGVALTAFSISSNAIDLPMTYTSEDKSIVFKHTEDLQFSPKPLKTHDKEILLKSELIKGFNAGVTVDRVKINNIKDFATAKGLAQKVVDVEMTKDGVLESIALMWREAAIPISASNLPAYEIEYKVESTRGKNHYLIKTSVVNKKLYVFTVQCKEDSYAELAAAAQSIIDSFHVEEGLNY